MAPGRRELLILGGAGLAAGVAGFLVGPALLRLRGDAGGEALRSASFPDLKGQAHRLAEWRGRVLVCNFWATWCAPCREEIPLLLAAHAKYARFGVEIVGIAVDNGVKVREFADSFRITYPVLLAEANGLDLMRKLGNKEGGLPYTVVADRQGNPVRRKLGALKQAELDGILDGMLGS
ncbi:MAG TPA: TlpA disulfide reductase family protein [Burkholderiales bacterium]|jgi:thiol-disulfide isomerase/thioredoxin|nr:TlpA disulfide reductase family protein [Burkholderiales bacterium]